MSDSEPLSSQPQPRWQRHVWLSVLVIVWGVQAIITQTLLLREALVLMYGSELAWGIVLFAWLFGVAIGGKAGGWIADRVRRPEVGLIAVLVALSLMSGVELWVFRGARAWLGVQPGELLPLAKTAVAAVLFVSPTSALVGAAFPMACCVGRVAGRIRVDPGRAGAVGRRAGLLQLGHVYALESAGSLLGGIVFSFWAVEHLAPVQTVLLCGAMTLAASAGLAIATSPKPYAAVCLGMLALWTAFVALRAGTSLERSLVERRWQDLAPGYELRAEAESKYQNLAVGELAGQYTLYANGQVTADFPDPFTFAPLAHFWATQHPAPQRVLILGGGAEGLLEEILRHPIEHVDYVEPDPRVIKLIEPFLSDADLRALRDDRVTVHNIDARYYAKTQSDRFDLVIARLPEPTSALHARLYTAEFYRELRRAMTVRSVLCLTAAATPGKLTPEFAEYLGSIRATLQQSFSHTVVTWGNPAQVLAATGPGLFTTEPAELVRRYTQRGVASDFFDPVWFEGATDWLDPVKLKQRAVELDQAANVEISTDLCPIVYAQRLALWERMMSGRATSTFDWLRSIGVPQVVVAIVGTVTLIFLLSYGRARLGEIADGTVGQGPLRDPWFAGGTVFVSVASSGFATMALSLVWLFAFQNLYGYVYQRIGWIIAVFMGGLVVGCALATWWSGDRSGSPFGFARLWNRLIGVDVLLAGLALVAPACLSTLAEMQSGGSVFAVVEGVVLFMVLMTGVLGGAAFAFAGELQIEFSRRRGSAVGTVVGADHAGACVGALFSGILLVPLFGVAATAYLLVGIKLGSALLLAAAKRRHQDVVR